MIKGQSIICFAPGDYWSMNPSCATHLMKQFAKTNRVLYINPFSSDLIGGLKRKKGLGQRILRKLKSLTKSLRKADEHFYVFSPLFLPFHGISWIDRFNNTFLRFQIKTICRFLKMKDPILWLENVRAADLLNSFEDSFKIYHVSDLFENDTYTSDRHGQIRREKQIYEQSDIVICVSHQLYDFKKANRNDVYYIPHGVDVDAFEKAMNGSPPLQITKDISKPIAGYFGTLTAHNDIELWEYCARQLKNVSFVFAGQITGGDYSNLQNMPNVHFIGKIPYEQIPILCSQFDVGMLAWKTGKWIESCNPLKMLEYMACGKPIVSVPIKEAEQYADLIGVARHKEEFCKKLNEAIESDNPEKVTQRLEIARRHSWQTHAEQISDIISQKQNTKS